MSRLLRADFARLWKTKSFWVCVGFTFVISVFGAALTGVLFFTGIFAALFLGTDYADGTIRNKIVTGRTRMEIYLSNLVTVSAGSLAICAASWLSGWLFGTLGVGSITGDIQLSAVITSAFAAVAMSAVCVLIAALINIKSSMIVITMSVTIGMLLCSTMMMYLLEIGKYFKSENPSIDLKILAFANNVLPSGQMMQLQDDTWSHPIGGLPVYSLGLTGVTSAVGSAFFKKRDLK